MSLPVGTRFGWYELDALLGKGAMGEVYRARDTRLKREVAIKILRTELPDDSDRVRRFQREAEALASLNHPNIAAIYDLQQAGDSNVLVLELVEGETLAERLSRGAMPVIESLEVARQICDGLDAAHKKGITHRDIKPGNIKITPEGRVKILDFGLAKTLEAEHLPGDLSSAPTLAQERTEHGLFLGTPAYMSPEQMRGEDVDARSDIWAFGCVLFELMAARGPFSGETAVESIAAVLKTEPPWEVLPVETPVRIRDLLRRCLQKEVAHRFQTISEARLELQAAGPILKKQDVSDPAGNERSLAVLPFANASSDPQMEYLSDGLTESVMFSLSQLPQLRLMSRSAVFRYKGRVDDVQEIGRALSVDLVLTGKVLQRADKLLISAELVDVAKGWQLWGSQYRRHSNDIFATEEEIAKEISDTLRLKLSPEMQKRIATRQTENVEAYHLYLKGRFHCGKRIEDALYKGIHYFREAIEKDPAYALPYAGLAEAYIPLAFYGHLAPADAAPKARAAAQKAIEIDPTLPEARSALGMIKVGYEWDFQGGEKEIRAALAADPSYPRAWQSLAECMVAMRRPAEAVIEINKALALDPLSLSTNAAVTMIQISARQYDLAIEQARKTVDMDPHFFPGHLFFGLALEMRGDLAEAVFHLEQARTLSNNSSLALGSLGRVFAASGRESEARNILRELDELSGRKYVSQLLVGLILAALDEMDQALTCLERSYEERCVWLRFAAVDPMFDRVRGEPRFQNIIDRIGL